MPKIYDQVIIGSGISGLSFAHYVASEPNKSKNILILESQEKPGGCFDTYLEKETKRNKSHFQLELNAHTCYNSYLRLISIIEDLDLISKLAPRKKLSFKILRNNKIEAISKNLSFLNLFLSIFNLLVIKKEGKTLKEYYQKILGKSNFNNLFKYAFNAVLSQESTDFPAEILFKKRINRRKDIFKSFIIRGGLFSIIKKIIEVHNLEINYNCNIEEIKKFEKNYLIKLNNDQMIKTKSICFATPANVTSQLISNLNSEISHKLSTIKMSKIESLAVVVKKKDLPLPLMTGIIPINNNFYSAVSSDHFEHHSLRGFVFHFKAELLNHDQKIKQVTEILQINSSKIISTISKKNALPMLNISHKKNISEVNSLLQGTPLFIVGNYIEGLAIEDCVKRSFDECQRYLKLFN